MQLEGIGGHKCRQQGIDYNYSLGLLLRDSATSAKSAKSAITGHFDLNLAKVQTLQCHSSTFFISIFKEARVSGYEKQDEMTAKCDLRLYSFLL